MPRNPKSTSPDRLPLALYLQATPHDRLHHRAERDMKAGDEAWVKAHPSEAERLDAMIGSRVTLARTFGALGPDAPPWRVGTEFIVAARWHDHLIGKSAGGIYLKLREQWLSQRRTD